MAATSAAVRADKASTDQIKMLFGLAKKAGIDNDTLHARVKALTGQEHISHLTKYQCGRVIDNLSGKKPEPREERPLDRASQEQISLILGLAKKLGWLSDGTKKRLNGFLRSRYHVERVDWLEPDVAANVIEALKGMLAGGRKERKGYSAENIQD